MGRRIDWYLVELEDRLKKQLPEALCVELSAEIGQHLESSAVEFESEQLSRDDAEVMAVKRFGTPSQVAWNLVDIHTPRSRALSVCLVICAGIAALWNGTWVVIGNNVGIKTMIIETPIFPFLFLSGNLVLILLARGCWRRHRKCGEMTVLPRSRR